MLLFLKQENVALIFFIGNKALIEIYMDKTDYSLLNEYG